MTDARRPDPVSAESVSSYRTILRSSSIMGASTLLNIFFSLVKMKVAAVLLGPAGVGLIGIYQNLVQTASSIAGLGLDGAGTRQVAAALGDTDGRNLTLTRVALLLGATVLALVGGFGFWMLSGWIAHRVFGAGAAAPEVAWLALGVALTIMSASQLAYLKGMRMIGDVARVNILAGFSAMALGILAIWMWGTSGVVALVLLVPLTTFAASSWFVARSRRLVPQAPRPAPSELGAEWRILVTLGVAFMLGALVMTAAELAVRSMVQRQLGQEALGQFQASWSIGMLYLALILGAMATEYYPRLTGVINDARTAVRTIDEQTEVALLLCGPLLLGMLSLAPWVIRLLYSAEFAPAVKILHWQLLGDTMKILNLPLGYVVLARGSGKIYIVIQALGAAAFSGATYLLLPRMGVAATGVAFIAMYAVALPLNLLAARYWLGFWWSRTVALQALLLVLASAALAALGHHVSDLATALVGVPLTAGFAIYAMVRLSRMAGLGGSVARIAGLARAVLARIR